MLLFLIFTHQDTRKTIWSLLLSKYFVKGRYCARLIAIKFVEAVCKIRLRGRRFPTHPGQLAVVMSADTHTGKWRCSSPVCREDGVIFFSFQNRWIKLAPSPQADPNPLWL